MIQARTNRPIALILIVYTACYLCRVTEYFLLRTDQGFFAEAFVHKLLGILVLALALRFLTLNWREIGFVGKSALRYAIYGLLLGAGVYLLAYGIEFLLQYVGGKQPTLQGYVTSYAIDGNKGNQTAFLFFLICIVGNVINVVMEEGVFRGLFVKLAERKHSFLVGALISSVLFGFWHLVAPIRSAIDGDMSATGAFFYALMLFFTTAITGFKFCLLTRITGSLWMPMADHLLNNTIINVLHVVTTSGADEMQVMRIAIAQTISFVVVLLYWKSKAGKKETFRTAA